METSPVPAGDLLPPPAERPELFGGGEVNPRITQSQFLLSKVFFFKSLLSFLLFWLPITVYFCKVCHSVELMPC